MFGRAEARHSGRELVVFHLGVVIAIGIQVATFIERTGDEIGI
jgi:hypothetical protein